MSTFKPLPRREVFKCRECLEVGHGNYFISKSLCKKCAAQRRAKKPNYTITLSNSVVVTTNVQNRLKKDAEASLLHKHPRYTVPYTLPDKIGSAALPVAFYLTFLIVPLVALVFPGIYRLGVIPLVLFATPLTVGVIVRHILAKQRENRERGPLKVWQEHVELRMLQLASERNLRMQEREEFYSSPEWQSLRESVIEEEGRRCNICTKFIVDDEDVTVDHIRPRSTYPGLALNRSNLQVLCRGCNARKGNRD